MKIHNSLLHLSNTVEPCTSIQSINTTNLASPKVPFTTSQSAATASSPNMSSIEFNSSLNIPNNPSMNISPTVANSSLNIPSSTTRTLTLPPTHLTSTTQVQHEMYGSSQHTAKNHEALLQIEPNAQLIQSILPTALVYVKDKYGNLQTCRVLLDSGSQASFVSELCIKRLSLPTQRANVKITGVGSSTAGIAKRTTSLDVYSRYKPKFQLAIQAFILPKITMPLPSKNFAVKNWHHLKSLELADPNYNEISSIDLLIGAEHFFDIIIDGKMSGNIGEPMAQNSICILL